MLATQKVVEENVSEASGKDEDRKMELNRKINVVEKAEKKAIVSTGPSMSLALFVYWILPILVLAVVSRIGVDTEPPAVRIDNTPVSITLPKPSVSRNDKPLSNKPKKKRPNRKIVPAPTRGPTAYQVIIEDIRKRKRVQFHKQSLPSESTVGSQPSATPSQTTGKTKPSSDPPATSSALSRRSLDSEYGKLIDMLAKYRKAYEADPNNVFKALNVADMLRRLDLTYHDGGSRQTEALEIYQLAIDLTLKKREEMIANGQSTNVSLSGTTIVSEEIMLDNFVKSVDGLLCSIYTNKGKQYFMANMFEMATLEYSKCIYIEPLYLDAVGSRGSARIILGQYKEAGSDFQIVLENDKQRMFNDVFTGMAKVLTAKEDAVPNGWVLMMEILDNLIPQLEENMARQSSSGNEYAQKMFTETLTRLHHVKFMYHDVKTKDVEKAWHHLETCFKFKMSVIAPYPTAFENQKLATTKNVFHAGFWPDSVGSDSEAPIFIIGFVRSGSTLLERVLDAHPLIVGTGEDSVSAHNQFGREPKYSLFQYFQN